MVSTARTGNLAAAATMSRSSSADEGSSQWASSIQRISGRARAVCANSETMNSYCFCLSSCGVAAAAPILSGATPRRLAMRSRFSGVFRAISLR